MYDGNDKGVGKMIRLNRKKTALIHTKRDLSQYTQKQLEDEIEQLLIELGSTLEHNARNFRVMSDLDLQVLMAIVEAQKARRNDSAFVVTIFSSLIALMTVATTDLIESWTISHLLTFTVIWLALLMLVERYFDHRMERLELLSEFLKIYQQLKYA